MTDTLGRIVRRVAAGTGGGSDLFYDGRALASGSVQLFGVSDLAHLGIESACRTLYSGPGFRGFWAAAPTGSVLTPTVADIDWRAPIDGAGAPTGTAWLYLGTHLLTKVGATSLWPLATLALRWRSDVGGLVTTGLYFAACPGRGTFPTATSLSTATPRAGTTPPTVTITSGTYADARFSLLLTDADVAPVTLTPSTGYTSTGAPVLAETFTAGYVSCWVGFYNSSGNSGTPSDAVGITLYTEPQS